MDLLGTAGQVVSGISKAKKYYDAAKFWYGGDPDAKYSMSDWGIDSHGRKNYKGGAKVIKDYWPSTENRYKTSTRYRSYLKKPRREQISLLGKRRREQYYDTNMRRTKYRRRSRRRTRYRRGYDRTGGYYGMGGGLQKELKFWDLSPLDAEIAIAGTIVQSSCNLIPQNTTESGRLGRKCIIKQIMFKYNILKPKATDPLFGSDTIRVVMYLDKQANGAAATVTDILEGNNFLEFNNLANRGRFKILYNKVHKINGNAYGGDVAGGEQPTIEVNGSFYKKCHIPLEFSGTTGVLTEIKSNNIGLMLLSRNGTNTKVSFQSRIRLRFIG